MSHILLSCHLLSASTQNMSFILMYEIHGDNCRIVRVDSHSSYANANVKRINPQFLLLFEPNFTLHVGNATGRHAGRQEVGRCRTRGESEE